MWEYLKSKGWNQFQDSFNFMPCLTYCDSMYDSDQYDDIEVAYRIEKARENENC